MMCIRDRKCALAAVALVALMGWCSGTVGAAEETPPSSQEAQGMYSDAAGLQNNGQFDLAADDWDKFLKKFPKDPLAAKAQHYLGVCRLQLKQYDKAAAAFQAVVTNHPQLETIQEAYLNLGWCQYSLAGQGDKGQYAKAAATFADLAKKFPDGKFIDQALFFWGESEYNQGKKKQALPAYQQLVADHAESPLRRDAVYALGVTQEELGQFADAGQTYDLFLKEFPKHELVPEIRMRKAETLLQAGDAAGAEKLFAEVAATEGFAALDHALSRRAFCLAKLGKFAEAGELYAKIATDFKQSPVAKDAALAAGRCYYRAERWPEAAQWLQTAVDAGGAEAPEAAHWLSRIHIRNREPQKATALLAKVLPQAANSPFAVNLQMDEADALFDVPASKPKSVALYLKIAAEHPEHESAPQALYNAAFATLELKQFAEALKHAEAFLKAYPKDRLVPDIKYVSAECQLQLNQAAAAEKAYRDLIATQAQHPDREQWQVRLALALFLQKKYKEVIADLEPAVKKLKAADNAAEAQYLLGVSHFQLDQFGPAGKALAASLQANPKWRQSDEVLLFLGRVQRQQNQLKEALATVRQLLADFPQSALLDQAHYRLGEFSYAAGDFATAVTEYDTVVSQRADSAFAPYAKYGKGWAQLKSNAFADAATTLSGLIKDHADHTLIPEARFARGMCRRQTGDLAGAVEDLDAFLAAKPTGTTRCDALYERSLAQVALKKFAEAAAGFEELLKADDKYPYADKALYELAWAYKSQEDAAKRGEAVGVFSKLAATYPDSPLAAEAHFHVGEAQYEKQAYAEAAKEYAAAKQQAKADDLSEKAIYKLGWAQFQQKQYDAAQTEFAEQLQRFPKGALQADALFMKAESLYRAEKYADALPAYQAAQAVELSSPTVQVLALLRGGQSAAQVKEWDAAVKQLQQVVQKFPDSAYLPEAQCELGWASQNAGKADEALKAYEAAATQSRAAVGARARFLIGELQFERKQFAEAIGQFKRVMFGYGGEKAPDDVKKWQAKAGFEAGRCAEVQITDAQPGERPNLIAEAQKAYQYVVEKHPQDELTPKAKERLAALAKL